MTKNALRNHLQLNIVPSDLFSNIREKSFDYILINPPYYPADPKDLNDMAWFCGRNFDYFENLFPQLAVFSEPSCEIIMILSEDCNLVKIMEIASRSGFVFQLVRQVKRMGEWNYIFRIVQK